MTELINIFPLPTWATWTVRSLCGTILGLVIYFGRNYFVEAKKFKNAIFTELEGLYPTPTKWPENTMDIVHILKEKYPRIEIAVHKFKGHLPFFLVKGFNKAWIKYYNEYEQEGWQSYFQYVPMKGESYSYGEKISEYDNTKIFKENFKKNVDNLLKYARQI